MAVVYKHTRLDNNEVFYIGIGKTEKRAYSKHNRNKHWKNITNLIDYKVDIIKKDLSWEEASKLEIELIEIHGRRYLNTGTLVNITKGGDGVTGHRWSEEQRLKLSGTNSVHYGKKLSKERKSKISGENSYWYGKTWDEENRTLISKRMIGNKNSKGHQCSVLQKERINKALGKPILQYSKLGEFIKEWNYIREAAYNLNINEGSITECLKGRNKTAFGYIWKYKNKQ